MPTATSTKYPFEVTADDHCESPPVAYVHLAPVLEQLAARLGKTSSELALYDPYYCAGGVKERLVAVGFPNV